MRKEQKKFLQRLVSFLLSLFMFIGTIPSAPLVYANDNESTLKVLVTNEEKEKEVKTISEEGSLKFILPDKPIEKKNDKKFKGYMVDTKNPDNKWEIIYPKGLEFADFHTMFDSDEDGVEESHDLSSFVFDNTLTFIEVWEINEKEEEEIPETQVHSDAQEDTPPSIFGEDEEGQKIKEEESDPFKLDMSPNNTDVVNVIVETEGDQTTLPTDEYTLKEDSDTVKTDKNGVDTEKIVETKVSLVEKVRTVLRKLDGNLFTYTKDNDTEQTIDGTTIEKIETVWLTRNAGKDRLVLSPTDNTPISVSFAIEFSLSGDKNYEEGAIDIILPANLFFGREGNTLGRIIPSIPELPERGAEFSYEREGDYLIITNTKTLSAASQGHIELTVAGLTPSEIKSGEVFDSLYSRIVVTTDRGSEIIRTSNKLEAQIHTTERIVSAQKRGTVYEKPTAEMERYLNDSITEERYLFVDWYTYANVQGNQPFRISISDPIENNGILLGGTLGTFDGNLYQSENLFEGYVQDGTNFYQHIYAAYPKDNIGLGESITIENTVGYELTTLDTNEVTKSTATGRITYTKENYIPAGASVNFQKTGLNPDGTREYTADEFEGYYAFAMNQINQGRDVDLLFDITTLARILPWTLGDGLDPENPESYFKKSVEFKVSDTDQYFRDDFITPLKDTDISLKSLKINKPILTDYKKNEQGHYEYVGEYRGEYPTSTIYGDDTKYAVVSFDKDGNIKTEAFNGAKAEGDTIIFPEGVSHFTAEFSAKCPMISQSYKPTYTLKANEKNIAYAKEFISGTREGFAQFRNDAHLTVLQKGRVLGEHDDLGYVKLDTIKQTVNLTKEIGRIRNYPAQQKIVIPHVLTVNIGSNARGEEYEEAIKAGILPHDAAGTYYDLLPKGMTIDTASIESQGVFIKSIKTIPNYKNSGRILVQIEVINEERDRRVGDTHSIAFEGVYTWIDMQDIGDEVTNVAVYGSDARFLGNVKGESGEPDDPSFGNNKDSRVAVEDCLNLLTDLNPKHNNPSFVYAKAKTKIDVEVAVVSGLKKDVNIGGIGDWSDGRETPLTVLSGQVYTYRIRMGSQSNASMSEIVLYDEIEAYVPSGGEDNPRFRGILTGVDISQIEDKGIKPVIYYAVKEVNLTQYKSDEENHYIPDLSDESVWTTRAPKDLSKVYAVAIDCTKDKDGQAYTLPPGESLQYKLRMKAPEGESSRVAVEENAHTYNNTYMSFSNHTGGVSENHYIHEDYTVLGIASLDLPIEKVWEDDDDRDNLRPNAVEVELYKDGSPTGRKVKLSEANEWKYTFSNLSMNEDGTLPVYEVRENTLADGYSQRYEFNSDGSGKIVNTHIPETITIEGTKTWVDNGFESNRPESIRVELFADGDAVQSKIVSEDTNWEYSFTAPKYQKVDGKRVEVTYTVTEAVIPEGYALKVDKYDLVNTYLPYEDLLITKKVEGSNDPDKEFLFTILLKDENGESVEVNLDGEYSNGEKIEITDGSVFRLKVDESLKVLSIPEGTVYEIIETPSDGYAQVNEENLSGVVKAGGGVLKTSVTNLYSAQGGTSLNVSKSLTGRELENSQFRFNLYDEEGNLIRSARNSEDGEVVFAPLTFTEKDHGSILTYTIEEENLGTSGYTYDSHKVEVSVKVLDNLDGTITVTATYTGDTHFKNSYEAIGELNLTAQKIFPNLKDSQFEFEVLRSNEILSTGVNDDTGLVVFDPIEFTEADVGEFELTVREKDLTDDTIDYDSHKGIVKVSVVDNGDGTLTVTATPENNTALVFRNKLKSGSLAIEKMTTEGSGEFEFKVKITPPLGERIEDREGEIKLEPITDMYSSIKDFLLPTVHAAEIAHSGKWGEARWSIDSDGVLLVEGGRVGGSSLSSAPWDSYSSQIKKIVFDSSLETTSLTDLSNAFHSYTMLEEVDLTGLNTVNVTNMSGMFEYCRSLKSIDLSHFDTSKVTNMASLFNGCTVLKEVDVSSFDTGRVTDMSYMFSDCAALTSVDLSHFRTPNLTVVDHLFYRCSALKIIDISNFDLAHAPNISYMFRNCSAALEIYLPKDSYKVTNTTQLFYGCSKLEVLDLGGMDTSALTTTSNMWVSFSQKARIYFGVNYFNMVNAPLPTQNSGWIREDGEYGPYTTNELRTAFTSSMAGWYLPDTTYEIVFNANGGTNTMKNQRIQSDVSTPLRKNTFVKPGSTFLGWATTLNGESVYEDGQSVLGLSTKGGRITLYAVWSEPAKYEIKDGILTVKVPSGMRAIIEDLPGGATYQVVEESQTGWVIDETKDTEGVIKPNEMSLAKFVNRPTENSISYTPHAEKLLDGVSPNYDGFSFCFLDENHNVIEEAINNGSSVLFSPIELVHDTGEIPKRYSFHIDEVNLDDPSIIYDNHKIEIELETRLADEGVVLSMERIIGGDTFRNITRPVSLTITKEVVGTEDLTKDFTFEITVSDSLGNPLEGLYSGVYFTDGKGEITLSKSESKIIENLPRGCHFRVNEIDIPKGYKSENPAREGVLLDDSSVVFTNTYSAVGSFIPYAEKGLVGRNLLDSEFSFVLLDSEGEILQMATNDLEGLILFDEIVLNHEGEYTFYMKEIETRDTGVIFDNSVKTIQVTAKDNGDGTLKTTILSKNPEFINTLMPGALEISKKVEGISDVNKDKAYEFKLKLYKPNGDVFTEPVTLIHNEEKTSIHAGDSFSLKDGESVRLEDIPDGVLYELLENVPDGFRIIDAENIKGIIRSGETIKAEITNVYEAETVFTPTVSKVLIGRDLRDQEFVFLLKDENDEIVSKALNTKDGLVEFTPITYSQADYGKTFMYYVEESEGMAEDVRYDARKIRLTVRVNDNGDGTIETIKTFSENPVFVNQIVKTFVLPNAGERALPTVGMSVVLVLLGIAIFASRYKRK